jgi:chromosome segregation ATPase
MGRGGVTYTEVSKVAEKLRNKGITPTIDRVREILGTGSKTTLAHHLKRWKNSTVEDLEYQSLPTALAKSVKNLYEQLQAHASQKIEELEVRAQKEIDKLLQQLKQEKENAGTLKKNILNLETSNNKLAVQTSTLEKAHEELKQINTNTSAEKSELTAKIHGKVEQILTLKEQLKSTEHNGEHYREMLKQQRDEEKIQFARHLELLQQENNSLRSKVAEIKEQKNAIKREFFDMKNKVKYFEKLYVNKVAENDLLSKNLLSSTKKQEKLLNDIISKGRTVKKKGKEIAA